MLCLLKVILFLCRCYTMYDRCDGHWICDDGSDEHDCTVQDCTFPFQRKYCPMDRVCVPANFDCPTPHQDFSCPADKPIRCQDYSGCYSSEQICDSFNDCSDGTDENYCTASSTKKPPTSSELTRSLTTLLGILGCIPIFGFFVFIHKYCETSILTFKPRYVQTSNIRGGSVRSESSELESSLQGYIAVRPILRPTRDLCRAPSVHSHMSSINTQQMPDCAPPYCTVVPCDPGLNPGTPPPPYSSCAGAFRPDFADTPPSYEEAVAHTVMRTSPSGNAGEGSFLIRLQFWTVNVTMWKFSSFSDFTSDHSLSAFAKEQPKSIISTSCLTNARRIKLSVSRLDVMQSQTGCWTTTQCCDGLLLIYPKEIKSFFTYFTVAQFVIFFPVTTKPEKLVDYRYLLFRSAVPVPSICCSSYFWCRQGHTCSPTKCRHDPSRDLLLSLFCPTAKPKEASFIIFKWTFRSSLVPSNTPKNSTKLRSTVVRPFWQLSGYAVVERLSPGKRLITKSLTMGRRIMNIFLTKSFPFPFFFFRDFPFECLKNERNKPTEYPSIFSVILSWRTGMIKQDALTGESQRPLFAEVNQIVQE